MDKAGCTHTAGPWSVGFRAYDVTAADGYMKVCDVRGWGYLTGKGSLGLDAGTATAIQEANARLIAAAPDLLEALKVAADLCVGTFAEGGTPHKRMLAAIAKATGASL